jgi:lipase chaperone LimK
MVTIPIKEEYFEILKAFGDVQSGVDLALQRFTAERVTAKIAELRQKDAYYRGKYGLDYPAHSARISSDETFVQHLETQIDKIWEVDLADWEFCYKGIEDWTRKLQSILLA